MDTTFEKISMFSYKGRLRGKIFRKKIYYAQLRVCKKNVLIEQFAPRQSHLFAMVIPCAMQYFSKALTGQCNRLLVPQVHQIL